MSHSNLNFQDIQTKNQLIYHLTSSGGFSKDPHLISSRENCGNSERFHHHTSLKSVFVKQAMLSDVMFSRSIIVSKMMSSFLNFQQIVQIQTINKICLI